MKIQFNEGVKWHGKVRVISRFKDGTEQIDEFDNTITDAGRNLLRSALAGTDAEIKYVALGNNSITPSSSDTQLGNEFFRKQVTKQETGATGVLITTVYIAPYEANQQIEEIGWFAGSDASDTPNSGVMVARVLYSKNKTELESLQIERTDTIS